jgi:UDP-glucose 4-epimerase
MEAVATNVYGAKNVIDASLEEGVDRVVCISTDKAVEPVNVMGMSKAIQEKILTSANDSPRNKGTRLVGVRYGNVLNSRGSVVPFFRDLIRRDVELTITSEEMTRFLLTLNQAVDLVFFACEHGSGGEIFVRKAASARVMDIARAVCDIAGAPFRHRVIGRYGGEKLHEILISEEERTRCDEKDEYFLINRWRQSTTERYGAGEYSSAGVILPYADVRRLIEESDRDEKEVEFEEGVFYR